MPTPIGNLNRRYSVRGRGTARDGRGERSTVYTHKFYAWGETPIPRSTTIRSESGALYSEDVLRMRFRYRSGFEIGDQIVDALGTYYVRSAQDVDGRRQFLQLTVSLRPVAPDAT